MNYFRAIRFMDTRIITDGLVERVLKAYNSMLMETGCGKLIEEYEAGKAALADITERPSETKLVKTLDKINAKGVTYAMKYAVKSGLFTAFEYFFSDSPTKEPLEKYVADPLLTDDGSKLHKDFRNNRVLLEDWLELFTRDYSADLQEQVDAVALYFENSIYGVLPYGFSLGCRCSEILIRLTTGKEFSANCLERPSGLDFDAEANAILDRLLGGTLLEDLITQQDMDCFNYLIEDDTIENYKEKKTAAIFELDESGLERLIMAKTLFSKSLLHILRFSFSGGMYAGFEQIFDKDNPDKRFFTVAEDLVRSAFMYDNKFDSRVPEYNELKKKIADILSPLEERYEDTVFAYTELMEMQRKKLYDGAFYLGYRYAIKLTEGYMPLERKMMLKILHSEYDLRVITSRERQEMLEFFTERLRAENLRRKDISLQDFDSDELDEYNDFE